MILDMDGVIVDSNPVHTQAWAAYLHQLGRSADYIDQRMHGRRNDDIVRDFFGNGLSEQEIHAHGARKEAIYREMMRPQLGERLVPGVRAFLERHSDVPMGVASNAEPANVEFILENARLRGYFRVAVDGHQVARPKPDPEIYLKTAELLGVTAPDCVIFEDSMTGIEAARLAGARVVGVNTTDAELSGVDLLIRDFTESGLEGWLATLPGH